MYKHILICLTSFIFASFATNTIAATQATFIASKLSGVAPMAVHFDATATTDSSVSNPFRELRYDFTFDDPSSGTWQYSGLSKNTESGGPLAAHIYDKPGTYTARLSVGNDTEKVTITVQNPNTVFAGSNTVCLSRNTNMSGCPSGAQKITSINSWPTIGSNKRYMLRAGQNFSSLGVLETKQIHNTRFTSFGSGAKPVVGTIYLQSEGPDYGPNWISNVDIIGLDASNITHGITGNNILIYKNNIHGAPGGIIFANAYDWYRQRGIYNSSLKMNKNWFIVENISNAGRGTHTGEGQTIWMGNLLGNTEQHNSRLWQAYKTFIAHNKYTGNSSNGNASNLKIHSTGIDPVNPDSASPQGHTPRSSYLVVAHNIFNSTNSFGIWNTVAFEPQNDSSTEGIENVIDENNKHIAGTYSGAFFTGGYGGRNITRRGAVVVGNTTGYATHRNMSTLPSSWDGPYFMDVSPLKPPAASTKFNITPILMILLMGN